jgi:hypothetical protein
MPISEYRVVPNGGLHPLLLGMTGDQVLRVMSEQPEILKSRSIPSEEVWRFALSNARLSMRDGIVVEVSITPPASVRFEGQSLFEDDEAWRSLVALDGEEEEALGFLVLRNLGLALSGLHDGDVEQRAITAFEKGRWDGLITQTPR